MHARLAILCVAVCAVLPLTGCGDDAPSSSGGSTSAAPAVVAQANYIAGKVTMADGTPLRGEIKDISLSIVGVSEAAEKVNYSPAVKPDGTYKQKVAGGQYSFSTCRVTVLYNGAEYRYDLEPAGNLWNKNQDAADGIVQDFVWKPSGVTPYGVSNGSDIGNHTHWYGMTIGLRADGYRNDIGKSPTIIPDGTKLLFTVKPTGKAIDGTEPKEQTLERVHDSKSYKSINLNDLLPCPYEMTGVAKLPDGTTKPLLLQAPGDYPNYKPTVNIKVEVDGILGRIFNPPVTFVID
jgi:hypothetical protein